MVTSDTDTAGMVLVKLRPSRYQFIHLICRVVLHMIATVELDGTSQPSPKFTDNQYFSTAFCAEFGEALGMKR